MSPYSKDEFTVKWTLHIFAPEGTNIFIRDKDDNGIENENMPSTGKMDFILTEYKRVVNDKQYHSPYTITATYKGEKEIKTVVLDSIQTVRFFDETPVENIDGKNILSLTPNPAGDYIEITFDNVILKERQRLNRPSLNVQVYNVLGVEVLSASYTPSVLLSNGENIRLDVSGLSTGIYFVHVGGEVLKFVKI